MLKNLINRLIIKFNPPTPTPLEVMKASLARAELGYLHTLDHKEYHACQADMKAIEAKHDFARCKRLQKFIEQEQRAKDIQKDDQLDALLGNMNCFYAFMEKPKQEDAKQGPTPPPREADKP